MTSPSDVPSERPQAAVQPQLVAVEPAPIAAPTFATLDSVEPIAPKAPTSAAARRVDQLRVLAGEHNGVHQLVLRTVLSQAGAEVVIVGDGHEVIDAWQRENWDVILLDDQLPGIDGAAVAQIIRAFEIKAGCPRLTPMVAMAPSLTASDVARFADCGMGGAVAKPIEAHSLLDAIEAAMAEQDAPAVADDWGYAEVA